MAPPVQVNWKSGALPVLPPCSLENTIMMQQTAHMEKNQSELIDNLDLLIMAKIKQCVGLELVSMLAFGYNMPKM